MGLPKGLWHDAGTAGKSYFPPMNRSFALLTALTLLGGCQTLHSTSPAPTPAVVEAPAVPSKPKVYRSFSEDSLFALLSAELAGQRNRYDLALSNYVEQANATQDAGVAERAFRIAEYLGAEQAALETAQIWAKNAPDNLDAQRATAIQLARAGQYERAMQVMEKVLQAQGDTHFDFLALSAAETDPDTRNGLLHSFDRLLLKYPENGQLLFGKALLLQQDGDNKAALYDASLDDATNYAAKISFMTQQSTDQPIFNSVALSDTAIIDLRCFPCRPMQQSMTLQSTML